MAISEALHAGQSVSQIHRETGHDRQTIRRIRDAGDLSKIMTSDWRLVD